VSENGLARVEGRESELLKAALDKNVGVDVMERLLAMAQKVREEEARAAWHLAMANFQRDVPEIIKNKTATIKTKAGYSFEYTYASLDAVIAAVRPKLAGVGLSITFDVQPHANGMQVTCIVGHAGGHRERCPVIVPISNDNFNAAQSVASAMTYGRRLSCLCALGLAPEDFDDDGAGTAGDGEYADKKPKRGAASRADKVAAKVEAAVEPPIWTGRIVGMTPTKGTNPKNREPYTIYVFEGADGKKFGTKDDGLASALTKVDPEATVEIVYGETGHGNFIIEEFRVTSKKAKS